MYYNIDKLSMFLFIFKKHFDYSNPKSFVIRLRKKRFIHFKKFISKFPYQPKTILDVGGSEIFWEYMNFINSQINITVLNISKIKTTHKNVKSVVGDARNLKQYKDKEFDIVFSNSVIEHVGNSSDQQKMAQEIQRVAKGYFIQTPNKYFPIEPHFFFLFFQFLPNFIQIILVLIFKLGSTNDQKMNKKRAIKLIKSIRLLSQAELQQFFPNSTIIKEKFLGITKSLMVFKLPLL